MNAQRRIDGQIFELHRLIADEIERRPDETMAYAQRLLDRWHRLNGESSYHHEWTELLRQGPTAVVAVMRDPNEHATLLRSVSPFGAILKDDRNRIFSKRTA